MSQIATKFIQDGAITNAKVNASAGIVYSKLSLTNSIVNSDISSTAAIAYSKLNLTGDIVNSDISATAAIAYSKLSLASSIQASDMNSGAATSGYVLTANGSGGATYAALPSGGANTALSNLASTAVNADINPGTDNTINLGASGYQYNTLSVSTIINWTGVLTLTGASGISMNSNQIHNVVDPTSAQDAATKQYVDNAVSTGGAVPQKETFVLSGTDITNQYIDLSHVAKTNSVLFAVKGAGSLLEGASYDYSISYTGGAGGNTRITFLNDLATGGAAALVATDVVQVNYDS